MKCAVEPIAAAGVEVVLDAVGRLFRHADDPGRGMGDKPRRSSNTSHQKVPLGTMALD
jgi:hypothetical protein